MKATNAPSKFNGILTQEQHQEVYKLCSVSLEEGTMTLSVLETGLQSAQQN